MLVLYVACERWKSRLWLSARGRARGLHEVPRGPRMLYPNWTAMDRGKTTRVGLLSCRVGSPRPPSLNEVGWDLEVGHVAQKVSFFFVAVLPRSSSFVAVAAAALGQRSSARVLRRARAPVRAARIGRVRGGPRAARSRWVFERSTSGRPSTAAASRC